MADEWHDVSEFGDVADDEPLAVKIDGHEVGVFLVGGTLYAIEDVCPHAYALLSQGFVEGGEVECSLHGATFHIPTGKCLKEPADRDLATYAVKVESNRILVNIGR